jgi:N4-(beta-N-acetylglucosaminyl)-L-asparaginase
MTKELTRRRFVLASAAVGAGSCAAARAPFSIRRGNRRGPAAVSSANGLRAVEIACEQMRQGWRPVDAAVKGVEVVENDPKDDSVGLGGLPNEDGVVTLDACVMDGPSGLGGAVAHLENIVNAAQVALKVMRHTDHVLLVGAGALEFARAHGFSETNLLTEESRRAWLRWKARRSDIDDWIDPEENGEHGREWVDAFKDKTGTIHVGAVDTNGDVGGCTTTSGLAFKLPGRVGDSPLLGCGNYVDNDVGAGGSTGRGEACILANGASYTVHMMAEGRAPMDAALETCRRVARMTRVARLLREDGRPDFQVKFYAINKRGEVGAASLYPSRFALCDDDGPRLADTASLYEAR